MSEKKFDVMHQSYGAMEKEYQTMLGATSVIGLLSFLLWLDPGMVTMYTEAGRLFQVFNASLVNYRRLLDNIDKIRQEVLWEYALVTAQIHTSDEDLHRAQRRSFFGLVELVGPREDSEMDNKSKGSKRRSYQDTTPALATVCNHCQVKRLGGVARCSFKSSKVLATDSRQPAKAVTGTQTPRRGSIERTRWHESSWEEEMETNLLLRVKFNQENYAYM